MTTIDNGMHRAGTDPGAPAAPGDNGQSNGLSSLFTTLLIAQIQNQDPLAPMEASQFVEQFAQMSQVEAMQTLANLTALTASMQESTLVVTLGSQVGSTVMVAADEVDVDGETISGGFTLDAPAADVTVTLTGPDGVEHRISLGAHDAGAREFEIDPAEHGLEPGRYAIAVSADNGEAPPVELAGELLGVRIGPDGKVILAIAGIGDAQTADVTRFLGRRSQ
ncbi:flagellar biosynthesis protein FlgD [Burkholderia ubonensis]|uniref:flagellar hook capping FlgD N-terminal domain-containing protein n=1 Tax=Burkholderia ubonensis TaxID=101571 RepID=UPI00075D8C49|nr:flagellar hook capping FlgD N-terminal domain-containing protein [Burkholderia ubonensis]KVO87667.1 flagellar biosynthesis protein FlgD [Burkholderia ubonensis]KVZ57284.1 flagellar biosynthesis protein FlgD [Burkholderia ubonensis]KVZ72981.1 flagellar biosynthesis protein FlgD [Burkholderia ubonensis]